MPDIAFRPGDCGDFDAEQFGLPCSDSSQAEARRIGRIFIGRGAASFNGFRLLSEAGFCSVLSFYGLLAPAIRNDIAAASRGDSSRAGAMIRARKLAAKAHYVFGS